MGLNGALAGSKLSGQLREKLALVTAAENGCDYCASAHTFLGKGAGIDEAELAANLKGESSNAQDQAALTFAKAIIANRGRVSDSDVQAVRDAGFGDEELIEILSVVSLNIFTNYFNEAFGVEVDFPVVSTAK